MVKYNTQQRLQQYKCGKVTVLGHVLKVDSSRCDGLICHRLLGQGVRGHNEWNIESWVPRNGGIN